MTRDIVRRMLYSLGDGQIDQLVLAPTTMVVIQATDRLGQRPLAGLRSGTTDNSAPPGTRHECYSEGIFVFEDRAGLFHNRATGKTFGELDEIAYGHPGLLVYRAAGYSRLLCIADVGVKGSPVIAYFRFVRRRWHTIQHGTPGLSEYSPFFEEYADA